MNITPHKSKKLNNGKIAHIMIDLIIRSDTEMEVKSLVARIKI